MHVKSIQSEGLFVNYLSPQTATTTVKHTFCGVHNTRGATCPNCNKPLLRFLELDLTDSQLTFKNPSFNKLSLFYCWTCNIAQDFFYYQIINENTIKILKFKKGGQIKNFPYDNYPVYFPETKAVLERIPENIQKIIKMVNKDEVDEFDLNDDESIYCRPIHQIGGEPYLVQKEYDLLICPICNEKMFFLSSIADDCLTSQGFVNNKYVQVLYYYCPKCFVVGAVQRVD